MERSRNLGNGQQRGSKGRVSLSGKADERSSNSSSTRSERRRDPLGLAALKPQRDNPRGKAALHKRNQKDASADDEVIEG